MIAGLPLTCIKGGAPGYKSTGRSRIYDSRTTINTINLPLCLYAPPVNLDRMICTLDDWYVPTNSIPGDTNLSVDNNISIAGLTGWRIPREGGRAHLFRVSTPNNQTVIASSILASCHHESRLASLIGDSLDRTHVLL